MRGRQQAHQTMGGKPEVQVYPSIWLATSTWYVFSCLRLAMFGWKAGLGTNTDHIVSASLRAGEERGGAASTPLVSFRPRNGEEGTPHRLGIAGRGGRGGGRRCQLIPLNRALRQTGHHPQRTGCTVELQVKGHHAPRTGKSSALTLVSFCPVPPFTFEPRL